MLLGNKLLLCIQFSILFVFPIAQPCKAKKHIKNIRSFCPLLPQTDFLDHSTPSRLTSDWTRVCSLSPFSLTLPLKLSLSPPPCPIHPTPTPEVKPYSWINLAAVWPNVHWHTSPHLSLSHAVYLSFGPSLPGGLLYRQMEDFNLYTKTMTSYWCYFATLTWCFILLLLM